MNFILLVRYEIFILLFIWLNSVQQDLQLCNLFLFIVRLPLLFRYDKRPKTECA